MAQMGRPRGTARPVTTAGRVKVNTVVSPDLAERLDHVVAEDGGTTSLAIERLLRDGLAVREVRQAAAQNALAGVALRGAVDDEGPVALASADAPDERGTGEEVSLRAAEGSAAGDRDLAGSPLAGRALSLVLLGS